MWVGDFEVPSFGLALDMVVLLFCVWPRPSRPDGTANKDAECRGTWSARSEPHLARLGRPDLWRSGPAQTVRLRLQEANDKLARESSPGPVSHPRPGRMLPTRDRRSAWITPGGPMTDPLYKQMTAFLLGLGIEELKHTGKTYLGRLLAV